MNLNVLNLLKVLAIYLMLACGTAYASEPASPVPATTTQSTANHAHATKNVLVSTDVGDKITDWSIAILAIIAGMFVSINFFDKKNRRK